MAPRASPSANRRAPSPNAASAVRNGAQGSVASGSRSSAAALRRRDHRPPERSRSGRPEGPVGRASADPRPERGSDRPSPRRGCAVPRGAARGRAAPPCRAQQPVSTRDRPRRTGPASGAVRRDGSEPSRPRRNDRAAGTRPERPTSRPARRPQLQYLRPVHLAGASVRHQAGLVVAPSGQRAGPFLRAANVEMMHAQHDRRAVGEPDKLLRHCPAEDMHHHLVQRRNGIDRLPGQLQTPSAREAGEHESVQIAAALGDPGRLLEQRQRALWIVPLGHHRGGTRQQHQSGERLLVSGGDQPLQRRQPP